MSIEDKIKTWVILDNQMNKCNLQIKDIRNKKNVITKDIVNNFNEKNMNFPVINISDGKLTICETQHSNVISFKFLLDCNWSKDGISFLHGAHQVAQKFNRIKFP